RPYSAERFLRIVDDLRSAVPDMFFSTDVIVGYPTETEAEFEETVALFRRVRFDMAFIFKYSPRSGTVSAGEPDHVPTAEKERRNQVLLDLLAEFSLARNDALVGTVQDILV